MVDSKIIKLVEPNCGRIVTVQVMAEEPFLNIIIAQIQKTAECLKAKVSVSNKIVSMEFPNTIGANAIRENFNNSSL